MCLVALHLVSGFESTPGFRMEFKRRSLDIEAPGDRSLLTVHCLTAISQHVQREHVNTMIQWTVTLFLIQVPANDHKAENNLLATQEKCETLKTEICETLRLLDKERRCDVAQQRNVPHLLSKTMWIVLVLTTIFFAPAASSWRFGFVSSERR